MNEYLKGSSTTYTFAVCSKLFQMFDLEVQIRTESQDTSLHRGRFEKFLHEGEHTNFSEHRLRGKERFSVQYSFPLYGALLQ